MRARVDIKDDVTVIFLDGYLDFETPTLFERDCLNRIDTSHVVFDFEGLNFIGSSGLTSFLQLIGDFSRDQSKFVRRVRFSRVGTEFKRLMTIGQIATEGFFGDVDQAIRSLTEPEVTPAFQNLTQIATPNQDAASYQIREGWVEELNVDSAQDTPADINSNPNIE